MALLVAPLCALAQGPRLASPTLRMELGAAVSTPYLKDANGATVRAGVAPALALGVAWDLLGRRSPTAATIGVRASRGGVRIRQGGSDTPVDPAWQLDATAGVERWVGRLGLRAAAGVTWLRGDETVAPFRFANGSPWHLAGEAGALARVPGARLLLLSLTAQAYRLGTAGPGNPGGSSGTVIRVLTGVRYGA